MKSPLVLLGLFIASQSVSAANLETDKEKFSYTVGIQIGSNLKQGDDIDLPALQGCDSGCL